MLFSLARAADFLSVVFSLKYYNKGFPTGWLRSERTKSSSIRLPVSVSVTKTSALKLPILSTGGIPGKGYPYKDERGRPSYVLSIWIGTCQQYTRFLLGERSIVSFLVVE